MTLDGKRIVVLGGSSGIGFGAEQAAPPAGTEAHVLDLADAAAAQTLFGRLGGFDHLVFTAGETLQLGSLASVDLATARRFFGLRYWGALLAAKYGSGSIRTGGSIVFTSGIAAARPRAGWAL